MPQSRPQSAPANQPAMAAGSATATRERPTQWAPSQFTAQLVVEDLAASVRFYEEAFGFSDVTARHPSAAENSEMRVMECNGLPFLLISENESQMLEGYKARSPLTLNTLSPTIITVLCTDIQAMYQQALNAGARSIQEPHQTQQGASSFMVTGRENYVWRFIDNFAGLSDAA